MFKRIKHDIKRNLINFPGWKTQRKIVVIESDDWGSIRTPSRKALENLRHKGFNVEKCHYMMNDSLASTEDLNLLFNVFLKFNDLNSSHPVLTANTIVANPDFAAIKGSDFDTYHYEDIASTFNRIDNQNYLFKVWKKGIDQEIFHPQFHGREHIQVARWMDHLKNGDRETLEAFDEQVYGVSTSVINNQRKSFLAAYDFESKEELELICNIISDGLDVFEKIFGFKSVTSIAPNYTWNKDMERVLFKKGVRYLQGGTVQRSPMLNSDKKQYYRRYTGQKNDLNQIYLVRNCQFEPASNPGKDWIDSCLNEIKISFRWNKPAIIESHRVNYIGTINPENRDRNLLLLEELLERILKMWPDVEFMSSDKLGLIIEESK